MASTSPTNRRKGFVDSSALIAAAVSSVGSARGLISLAARDQSPIVLFVSRVVWQETERNRRIKAPRGLPYFLALEDTGAVRFVDPPEPLVRDVGRIVVA